MGVIFKNSVMYSGDINQIYNGMNIDYSTILYSNTTTSFQSPLTYTASKDCIVYVAYNGSNSTNMRILINNQQVTPDTLSSRLSYTLILDKNDTIQSRYDAGNAETCYCTMKIYPIIYPTKDILPIIYSEEEREIGCWTDGKPLYQKTAFITPGNTISMVGLSLKYVQCYSISTSGGLTSVPYNDGSYICWWMSSDAIRFATQRSDISQYVITYQYTKDSDSPGSGQWTPQGVPAHHYSTEEQIVGTWIDGSTIYEKTYSGLSVTVPKTFDNTWTNTNLLLGDIDTLISGSCIDDLKQSFPVAVAKMNSNTYIGIILGANPSPRTVTALTIRYTKST